MSFKQAHVNGNNSYSKPFTYELNKYASVPWKQPSLSKSNVIFREAPGSFDDFIANKYKKCLYVNYQKQLYIKVKVTRRKYC